MNMLACPGQFKKQLLLLLAIVVRLPFAIANDLPPIHYLGIEQGLSNNSVRTIYQDKRGFMWFGTYDGLSRYDGYEFKVFRNKINDSNSLVHNYIYAVSEDNRGNIWVGTGQGINVYNNLTGRFSAPYCYAWGNPQKRKMDCGVSGIMADKKGNVFFGTTGWGLMVLFDGADAAVQIPYRKNNESINGYGIQAIHIDEQQRVWIFINTVGLCLYDSKCKEVQLVDNTLTSANCLQSGSDGDIWIGTTKGLHRYAAKTHSIVKSYYEEKGQLTSGNIATLFMDRQQKLWIGTEGGGINILNTGNGALEYLLPSAHRNGLSSESVYAIFEDREHRKWIGTLKGGINILDEHKNRFQTIANDPVNRNSLVNNFVAAFLEDKEKNLWIGTDGGGISIWNRKKNTFTHLQHDPANPSSLSHNSAYSLVQDYLGAIWVGSFGGGINRYNASTHSFEQYKCINGKTGEENKNVCLLFEDHYKTLWATTFGNGKLYRFNREANRFEDFVPDLNDLLSITEDRNGELWAGNTSRVYHIDRQHKTYKAYEIGKPVRSIYEDKEGQFWLGTEGGGLILFDRRQARIVRRYSDADGLCNNSILSIVEDGKGQFWLSTFNGLSRFDPKKNTFKNFYQSDGLQSNQFLFRAALKLSTGELAFGGIKGFNIFQPANIYARSYMPAVQLTGLRVENLPVNGGSSYIVKASGDQIQALKLPYNKAVLSFDFAALEYTSPGKIKYAYKLQGWDKEWNYTTNIRTVNYTNIREGDYVLRIRATNSEGEWNKEEVKLSVVVLPPWYRAWWAYLLYALAVVGAAYTYNQYKTRDTRLRYKIKLANLEKEKEKELNEKKLSFFTNISHEFRTPLTLIINPIKDLVHQHDKVVSHADLSILYRNARRLLSLVDQLLLFRKADSEAGELKLTRINYYDLCKEVYLCFIQQARMKQIEYHFTANEKTIWLYGDREKLEVALFNLISNALKFTPEGGVVQVQLTETEDLVYTSVSDTGCGIEAEAGERLFQKFYQVSSGHAPAKAGFGIGLYLVKYFIDSHKGTIDYKSEKDKGACFTIALQKGKEHFGRQYIFEEVSEHSVFLDELMEEPDPVTEAAPAILKGVQPFDEIISDQLSILIVDDNEQIRNYLKETFSPRFSIYEAADGKEGLQLARQHTPDIIISDIVMDNMNGVELCSQIKQDPDLRQIPVILLTASSTSEIKLKGIECGADDYITKPFEKDMLVARVASILKSREHLQQYFYNEITLQTTNVKISAEYKEFLERCIAIVEEHLEDEQFTIKVLATEIGMSHSNLYKRIKSISGQSANAFIRFIRLRKAAQLFITTDLNINQVAFQVGFNDIKYFREQFNKIFKMNPSDYIKKYRKVFTKNYRVNDDAVEK